MSVIQRRMPIGAEIVAGGVNFRVWAPNVKSVTLVVEGATRSDDKLLPMQAKGEGYFELEVPGVGVGTLYRYRLGDSPDGWPDPATRFQPEGPHGPSQVVDPSTFKWTDEKWAGCELKGQVLYEMHVGTFTKEGTWAAAANELAELARIGITCIEMMPVAEFPGEFGWGYDGVDLFAPTRLYGTPDDLRAFINRAHEVGIGVILDVVYNHFGPDGNYMLKFAKDFITTKYDNEWGDAINFDGKNSQPVREFFINNAGYWIEEFHFDGLRLDATQQIFDDSEVNILAEITERVRKTAGKRATIIVGENEPQDVKLIKSIAKGGYGIDCLWNDDLHHSAMVALTGKHEAYYSDYRGLPQEFISATKYGYLYQGQWYSWQKQCRGTASLKIDPAQMITFMQNHDQIANNGKGLRVNAITSPGRFKAMTAFLLLTPGTPMLFQGQEFGATQPFNYFAHHGPELAAMVDKGRSEFMSQFRSVNNEPMRDVTPKPHARETFDRCKLDFSEREKNAGLYKLTEDLLRLRRELPAFARQERGAVDGAVIGNEAFVLRFFGETEAEDALMLVNFDRDLDVTPVPEPLMAPPAGCVWKEILSTEAPEYDGCGQPPAFDKYGRWYITAQSTVILVAEKGKVASLKKEKASGR